MPNDTLPHATNSVLAEQRWLAEQLMDAIRTEQRLLEDLARLMRLQRAAFSTEDHEALDDATFGIQRVLQTLNEASRRPRIINAQLAGTGEGGHAGGGHVALSDLVESLGLAAAPQLIEARDDLRETARLLEDEVRTNRALLGEALAKQP